MDLLEKSKAVSEVFIGLDEEVKDYLSESNLTCFSGCGQCCSNPKVNASVMEFLPLSFDIYEKGKAEEILEILSDNETQEGMCIMYKSTSDNNESGYCTNYKKRGLICRLFGNSARKNKYGQKEILTCKKIKNGKKEEFLLVSEAINNEMKIPSGTDAYYQLNNLDGQLTEEQYPINVAIKKSLEAVLRYAYYKENQEV